MSSYFTDSTTISGSCTGSATNDFGKFYFYGPKDKQFIKNINKELIKKILNQKVFIYEIDFDKTIQNIYDESEEKVYRDPKQTWARILFNPPEQNQGLYSVDTKYQVTMDFYSEILNEQDIKLVVGSILRIGGIDNQKTIFLEITKLVYQQPTFGQTENLLDVQATCQTARQSLVSVLNRDNNI